MPGLVPGIHVFLPLEAAASKTWMVGTSPAMTVERYNGRASKCARTVIESSSFAPI
jgi:hypothetical protein